MIALTHRREHIRASLSYHRPPRDSARAVFYPSSQSFLHPEGGLGEGRGSEREGRRKGRRRKEAKWKEKVKESGEGQGEAEGRVGWHFYWSLGIRFSHYAESDDSPFNPSELSICLDPVSPHFKLQPSDYPHAAN